MHLKPICKTKAIELLQENTGGNLRDTGSGNEFFLYDTKRKTDK